MLAETGLGEGRGRGRVEELLHLVGLEGMQGRYPIHLTKGMRKRVALAQVIALQPAVILYDEPTAGLDPPDAETMISLIRDVQNRFRHTALIVTSDLRTALEISDRLALLHAGVIAFQGSPERLLATPPVFLEALRRFEVFPAEAPGTGREGRGGRAR